MLNESQKEAVHCTEGPLLVIAGAGAGKTHTLTERVSYLIEHDGVDPSSIICVTFTNKAAKEMRERIAKRLSREVEFSIYRTHNFPLIGTFHALGIYFLRQYLHLLPHTRYDKNFVIYDEDDKMKLIREIMASFNIEKDSAELNAKGIAGAISHSKNRGMSAVDYAGKGFGQKERTIQEVFAEYEKRLGMAKGLDFDDILLQWLNIMRDENIRAAIQARYQYFLVDEYQDTNQVQYQIVKHLASASTNLCVVGDDWQGIYSWRGANIANILSFQKDYPQAKVVKLEQNYRSTQNIINAANAVIKKNKQTYEKTMWTDNDVGETIEVFANSDDKQEAATIADLIKKSDDEYGSWAILYRTNSQSRIFEEAFLHRNIPYKIYGGFRFYERKEVKDLLGYLRLLANPFDIASIGRILNVPARKLGPKALSWVLATMEEKSLSFEEFLHYLPAFDDIPGSAKSGLALAHDIFLDLYEKRQSLSVFSLLAYVIEKIGYKDYLEANYFYEELEDKKQNVEELLNLASRFEGMEGMEGLNAFLEDIALMSDLDNSELGSGGVSLMTVHMAKGLEFENVVVVGLEQGMFPHSRVLDNLSEMEEERRCMYVAMTRAKKHLYLSYANSRFTFGSFRSNPKSTFLREIPAELTTTKTFGSELFGWFSSSGGSSYSFSTATTSFSSSLFRKSVAAEPRTTVEGKIKAGDLLAHAHFGKGRVVSLDGDIATIAFADGKGIKRLNVTIAPLTKIEE